MSGDIVYLDDPCPTCRRKILDPFVRGSVQYYRHNPSAKRRPCNLVVAIDPMGSDHRIEVVHDDERYEDVLERMIERHDHWERLFQATFRAVRGRLTDPDRRAAS